MIRLKSIFFTALIALSATAGAQEGNLQETARAFMRSGDFDNAIMVLNKGLQSDKENIELQKELLLAYYYKRDYAKAQDIAEKLIDRDDADATSFQLAGNVYRALENTKEAGRMYRRALKKFPASGPLYSEYGELLAGLKDPHAIEQWERGIQADPSFSGNYYNAAAYYASTKDKVWALLYGEIFVNMESLTERATAMKKLLLQLYKERLFATDADPKTNSEFAKAFLQTAQKQSGITTQGITAESLTAIRTRFLLDWYASHATKFPFKLFDYQQQLAREGMFEAYNQWLFGTVENLPAYETWTRTHNEAHTAFSAFQRSRVFRIPQGQYYQKL
jgi:tetratricopeptide (TPR) repeat protein